MIIFSLLILAGFAISLRSTTGKKIVTIIYTLTVLWYCFFCRLPLFTSVPAAADDTGLTQQMVSSPSLTEQIWKAVVAIFGSQPDGTLAGGGIFRAIVMNCLLFVPCGYLLMLWMRPSHSENCEGKCENRREVTMRGKERQKISGRITAVVIALALSITIELLQEITGLGMADWKDVLGNVAGAAVGVLMVLLYDRHRTVEMQ